MKAFDDLWEVATRLNGPEGCSWDRKQTFKSLQPCVLEEAHEVVEAVDRGSNKEIVEELGDLLYTILFYAKLGEKAQQFTLQEILEKVREKLIRRHPHVFEELKEQTDQEALENWEKIKREKEGKSKNEFLKELPALAKAQKMIKIFNRTGYASTDSVLNASEEEIANRLLDIVRISEKSGVDCEGALRRLLLEHQKSFQKWESLL